MTQVSKKYTLISTSAIIKVYFYAYITHSNKRG